MLCTRMKSVKMLLGYPYTILAIKSITTIKIKNNYRGLRLQ